jgi:hypothetical protein
VPAVPPDLAGPQDEELAERIAYTCAALSRGCHQHPYELAPTSSVVLEWVATGRRRHRRLQSCPTQARP